MSTHTLSLVEVDPDGPNYSCKAVCSCSWEDGWHLASDYPTGSWESNPGGAVEDAQTAAIEAGTDHVADTA